VAFRYLLGLIPKRQRYGDCEKFVAEEKSWKSFWN
jgi:hypothetical protein